MILTHEKTTISKQTVCDFYWFHSACFSKKRVSCASTFHRLKDILYKRFSVVWKERELHKLSLCSPESRGDKKQAAEGICFFTLYTIALNRQHNTDLISWVRKQKETNKENITQQVTGHTLDIQQLPKFPASGSVEFSLFMSHFIIVIQGK